MNNQIIKFLFLLVTYVFLSTYSFAQKTSSKAKTYKGVFQDDIPAYLTIKPDAAPNSYILTIRFVGDEIDYFSFKATFGDNYDKTRTRYFGGTADGSVGLFLYDVSKDVGKDALNILSGYSYSSDNGFTMQKMIFFLEN